MGKQVLDILTLWIPGRGEGYILIGFTPAPAHTLRHLLTGICIQPHFFGQRRSLSQAVDSAKQFDCDHERPEKIGCHAMKMTLLKRGFPGIVKSYSDPRPGVKHGTAFGRSYEEQRPCSKRYQVLEYTEELGFLISTT